MEAFIVTLLTALLYGVVFSAGFGIIFNLLDYLLRQRQKLATKEMVISFIVYGCLGLIVGITFSLNYYITDQPTPTIDPSPQPAAEQTSTASQASSSSLSSADQQPVVIRPFDKIEDFVYQEEYLKVLSALGFDDQANKAKLIETKNVGEGRDRQDVTTAVIQYPSQSYVLVALHDGFNGYPSDWITVMYGKRGQNSLDSNDLVFLLNTSIYDNEGFAFVQQFIEKCETDPSNFSIAEIGPQVENETQIEKELDQLDN